MEIVLLEQIVERRPADPEQFGGVRDIAFAARQRVADHLAVGLLARALEVERLRFLVGRAVEVEIGRA